MTPEEIQAALRADVRAWARQQKTGLLYQIARLGLKDTGELAASIKEKVTNRQGYPERITFSFARQGIFAQLGVGRGTKINQVGNTNRKAQPWLSEGIPITATQELADIVAKHLGDQALEEIKLALPK